MATIAVFLALGGGYAVAFSGSGSLQKAQLILDNTPGYQTVRTLTGLGRIEADDCVSGGSDAHVRFRNTAGKPISYRSWEELTTDGDSEVVDDVNDLIGYEVVPNGEDETIRLYLYPTDGSKRPQANIAIGVTNSIGCSDSRVSVLALNTEE